MKWNDFCKTDIEFMNMERLKTFCSEIGFKNIVLIMSKSASRRYGFEELVETLQKKYNILWLSESVSYPDQDTLFYGYQAMRDFVPDVILAIGGGSSIDFAKGLKVICMEDISAADDITHILLTKEYRGIREGLPIIAIPTTAGTGSELTKWATIWDRNKECKYSLDMEALKPDKAIIVPELTKMAGAELSLVTGLDALSHAIEAYWSKNSNVLVRQFSKQSIELILKHLSHILENPGDLQLREKQCLASVLAGMAFSCTRTTACHSISYPLTMEYQIPHGIAVAMTLAQVSEINKGHFEEEEDFFNLFQPYGGIKAYLYSVCENRIKLKLKDYGIGRRDIPVIVDKSFTLGRMDNNPVAIERKDVEKILQEIYE